MIDYSRPETYTNKIIWGDCLDVMKRMPDKCVDMILCDLPYGITACRWDIVIPFEPLWECYKRIIKDNGAIVLTASQPFTSMLVMSNIEMFKYEWIWDKKHPKNFLNASIMPLKRHESILVFSKNLHKYFPIMRKGTYRNKKAGGTNNGCYGSFVPRDKFNNDYYPASILELSSANQLNKEHPTQKPVELFRYLIKTYTNEGDLVLDNCFGSGTTGVAAYELGRRFIGIEKELKYIGIARRRLDAVMSQQNLFRQ